MNDSITTIEKDMINTRQLWVYLAVAVFSTGWAGNEFRQGNTAAGAIFLVLVALVLYQAWQAYTTRIAVLTVDATGIGRTGGWGWHLPWEKIATAEIDDHNGRDYLLVMRTDPNAPTHPSAAYLWGSKFPRNSLATPIPWDQKEELERVLAQYR